MKYKVFSFCLLFLFILLLPVQGQKENKKRTLSGYVTDINGNPVAGVMILIDKNNTNKVTDSKGFYKVKISPGAVNLSIFTFRGDNLVIPIGNRTAINITLGGQQNEARNTDNEKERVEIGYGSIKKEDVTNQVNKVGVERNKYSSYTNIYDALRGTVPGLQVRGKSITIQGLSSNNPNSEPLFVVDGMVVSSIDYIVPTDIKSIEVLKGASASIYGSRGANGVIMIKLIRGPETK
jgi:TonB-dependent SusC/RagA subfamily outer membrane receptor